MSVLGYTVGFCGSSFADTVNLRLLRAISVAYEDLKRTLKSWNTFFSMFEFASVY